VLAGIEVARRLRETGAVLEHELRVVDFLGEEPNDHGVSCIGSRAVAGAITADYLSMPDSDGVALRERLGGCDGWETARWSGGEVAGFVELHVEQGPVLERDGLQLGVVTAIAGIERAIATFHGRPDHAGTMPMGERRDALLAAAEAVLVVEQLGCSAPETVATVGRVETRPGALNIVPSWARIWAELRSASEPWLDRARGDLASRIADAARARGVDVELDWLNDQPPVPTAQSVQDLIASSASAIGYSWRAMPSGAGHDAAHIASLAPTGMIFIPSRAGRSHCPEEWTDAEAIGIGAHTLAATLLAMDIASLARQEDL
jgi:N-carbamoyl-L-amino-acid hydrolase